MITNEGKPFAPLTKNGALRDWVGTSDAQVIILDIRKKPAQARMKVKFSVDTTDSLLGGDHKKKLQCD